MCCSHVVRVCGHVGFAFCFVIMNTFRQHGLIVFALYIAGMTEGIVPADFAVETLQGAAVYVEAEDIRM